MSETGNAAPKGNGDVEVLTIYNSVHHREQNAIDLADQAAAQVAAQVYNAAMQVQGGIAQAQMANIHPLNFASIGAGSLGSMLNKEVDVLANIARGDAQAQEVMLKNYENLASALIAQAADANAELAAALGTLDALIREESPTTGANRA